MNGPNKLQLIQGYRAFAVLLVLVSHALHEIKKMLAHSGVAFNDKSIPGDFGVDLFFVISGFIMVYTTVGHNGSLASAVDFMKRRVIRIVPLYWAATTLMIAAVILLPGSVETATAVPENWLKSYLFIPFGREFDGLFRPVLGLGWSLNYEMFFYAIFAICLIMPRAVGLFSAIALLCVMSLFDMMHWLGDGVTYFWGRPIVLEFGFGIMIGWAYTSGKRIPVALGLYGVIVGTVAAFVMPEYHISLEFARHIMYGLPATMLVAAAVLTRGWDQMRIPGALCKLGDISYSTYLVHPFVLGFMTVLWKTTGLSATLTNGAGVAAYIAVVIGCGHLAAYLVHTLADEPFTRWLAKQAIGRKKPDAFAERLARI